MQFGVEQNFYSRFVDEQPMLTADEEYELASKWRETRDLKYAHRIVESHQRFVMALAREYYWYHLPVADLIQEGNVGLMQALEKYDPDTGVRFCLYASHWIKAAMFEYIIANVNIVKGATTKAYRKLFFNIKKQPKQGTWFSAEETKNLAEQLNVKEEDVREMELRMRKNHLTFGVDKTDDGCGFTRPLEEMLASDVDDINEMVELEQHEYNQQQVRTAISKLNPRQQKVIEGRWFMDEPMKLREFADEFGVSIERVRQIEDAAIKKIRKIVDPNMAIV